MQSTHIALEIPHRRGRGAGGGEEEREERKGEGGRKKKKMEGRDFPTFQ